MSTGVSNLALSDQKARRKKSMMNDRLELTIMMKKDYHVSSRIIFLGVQF